MATVASGSGNPRQFQSTPTNIFTQDTEQISDYQMQCILDDYNVERDQSLSRRLSLHLLQHLEYRLTKYQRQTVRTWLRRGRHGRLVRPRYPVDLGPLLWATAPETLPDDDSISDAEQKDAPPVNLPLEL